MASPPPEDVRRPTLPADLERLLHDLRGPLNSAVMHLEVVKRAGVDDPLAKQSLETIGQELVRLARMLRKREYYQELLGARRYEVALANYHWAIYILLGKLSPTLYVLRKKTGDTR